MASKTIQQFTLSMPPSANRLWRMDKRGFMRKSAEAIAYYELAGFEAIKQGAEITDREIAITLKVYRARKSGDLDNRIKPLLDALQGVAFYDDKQIVEIHAFRFDDKHNPRVEVMITPLSSLLLYSHNTIQLHRPT